MHAMVLTKLGTLLVWTKLPERVSGPDKIRIKVDACGVSRTHLHVLDGGLPSSALPIIPGHEIVGHIDALGNSVTGLTLSAHVGMPLLGHTYEWLRQTGVTLSCTFAQPSSFRGVPA